jgi:hypothetical protein
LEGFLLAAAGGTVMIARTAEDLFFVLILLPVISPVYALSPPFFFDFSFGIRKIDRLVAGLSPLVFCASAAINEKKINVVTTSHFTWAEKANCLKCNCLKITS